MGRVITVHYDNKPLYNITIDSGYGGLPGVLKELGASGRKLCIVADSTTGSLYLDVVLDIVKEYADKVISFIFEAGEQSKNLDTVGDLYEKLINGHFDRKDIIIALGGGVTGDLAGYTAATYLRGIRVIQLPTSLLAMVDSSIGGKTGVDFRGYKNMVGSFHQPSAVYINTSTLETLTDAQYFSGFGEIIKHGLIKDMKYFEYICANIDRLKKRDINVLEEVIAGSCEIKRAVVENDPEEKGERALLNFGHTLGHAIEKLMDFSMLHGECVAAGMVAASYISMERGMTTSSDYNRICTIIEELNLPLYVNGISAEEVVKISKSDKKMDAGKIKFILLDGMGNAVIRDDVTDNEMLGALNHIIKNSWN